jgi:hypothetical protein
MGQIRGSMISNKKSLRLIQEAYDMGYAHGLVDGKNEKHVEIVNMLTKKLDGTDWLQEDPISVRDIVPLVSGKKKAASEEKVWG